MFGIGGVEFILILLFVFIIFGADRLPEIARVLGKAIAKFRKAQAEMNAAIQTDVKNLETDEQPFQKSVEAFDKFGKEAASAVKETVSGVQQKNEVKYGKSGVPVATAAGAAAANAAHAAAEGQLETEAKKPEAQPAPIAAKVGNTPASPLVSTAPAASATGAASTSAPAPRRESFTERKARYEAERAARAAAEAAKAAEAAAVEAAPAAVPSGEGE